MRGGGIWHAILLLILFSTIMGVIQLAIVFLIVWGLLFRTRETIGMLVVLLILGLIDRHPWASVSGLALTILATLLPRRPKTASVRHTRTLPPPR